MSATLFDIKPRQVQPKVRKQRSDKGKPRKVTIVEVKTEVPPSVKDDHRNDGPREVQKNFVAQLPSTTIQVCSREQSWGKILDSVSSPSVALPLIGSLTITGYLVHQGYNYLLASNDWISALSTSVAAEAVMMCAAAAHAFSKGISKFLLLGVMGAMVVSGAMYMHSSVAAGAKGSDAVYQRAVEARNGIAESLDVARRSVEGIPETYASKRAVALQSVTELETKLSASDASLAQLSPAPAGVTYNLLVRLCAMVLCLMLTHMAVRGIKE